jgi:hypothetical protein
MKRLFFALTFLFFSLFFTSLSYGQEGKKISYVEKGNAAPFSGILLSPNAYADLQVKIAMTDAKIASAAQADKEKFKAWYETKLDICEERLFLRETMWRDRFTLKEDEITKLEELAFKPITFWDKYKFEIGIPVGILLSVGAFLLHDAVVDQAEK